MSNPRDRSSSATRRTFLVGSSALLPASATMLGSANPNGVAAAAWFRFSATDPSACSDAFGTVTTTTALGAGHAAVPYSVNVGTLSAGTTYWYCAISSNQSCFFSLSYAYAARKLTPFLNRC